MAIPVIKVIRKINNENNGHFLLVYIFLCGICGDS
jgi:hypothetical protein